MDEALLLRALEAVLFASAEPLPLDRLAEVFEPDGVDRIALCQALGSLTRELVGRGLELREVGGGWQLRTRPEVAPWLARLQVVKPVRFSRAALEALAMVAYRQPVTRAEVEEVRGVDCGGVLKMLLERGLVRIVGKKDVPGRPLLYGTSRKFLEVFGLSGLGALPSLRDLEELLAREPEGAATPAGVADEAEEPSELPLTFGHPEG